MPPRGGCSVTRARARRPRTGGLGVLQGRAAHTYAQAWRGWCLNQPGLQHRHFSGSQRLAPARKGSGDERWALAGPMGRPCGAQRNNRAAHWWGTPSRRCWSDASCEPSFMARAYHGGAPSGGMAHGPLRPRAPHPMTAVPSRPASERLFSTRHLVAQWSACSWGRTTSRPPRQRGRRGHSA
jgi:hypothetical protein